MTSTHNRATGYFFDSVHSHRYAPLRISFSKHTTSRFGPGPSAQNRSNCNGQTSLRISLIGNFPRLSTGREILISLGPCSFTLVQFNQLHQNSSSTRTSFQDSFSGTHGNEHPLTLILFDGLAFHYGLKRIGLASVSLHLRDNHCIRSPQQFRPL